MSAAKARIRARKDVGRAEGNWRANIDRRKTERRARRKGAATEIGGQESFRPDQLNAENDG